APLVAVVGLEVEVRPVAEIEALRLQHAATRIAADALLDLDHVGAEVVELERGDRPLLPDGPVDDAHPVERHRTRARPPGGLVAPRRGGTHDCQWHRGSPRAAVK